MFSGLNTSKLQTLGLTRKGRPFFMTYQTHFLRQYPASCSIHFSLYSNSFLEQGCLWAFGLYIYILSL